MKTKTMTGIFYAAGPAFKQTKSPVIDNINVYPLVLKILGLNQQGQIDGRLEAVNSLLK